MSIFAVCGGEAALVVATFTPLRGEEAAAVTAEGGRLLAFTAADAQRHDVRVA